MDSMALSPSEFVKLFNQTLEAAYPFVVIEGELSNFQISKNRWVYFDLKDETASVKFFGTVYSLPGPLEDGLTIRVIGSPRLHERFGFSINVQNIAPIGEGSIKKAAELLRAKLEAEGLFEIERKRLLPIMPTKIGLITAVTSAAYVDFTKILGERWGGVELKLIDVYVQGQQAPSQIVAAIEHFNRLPDLPEVIVLTRGGGSAEDLAAFNDERVVRAVAASRAPTLVAVGHEIDISLAELAADQRASTPSNAAQIVVPNRAEHLSNLVALRSSLTSRLIQYVNLGLKDLQDNHKHLTGLVSTLLEKTHNALLANQKLIAIFDPLSALKRGYAIITRGHHHISSIKQTKLNDKLNIRLGDGSLGAKVEELVSDG